MAIRNDLLCQQFARIIGGQPGFAGGKCVATINRNQIRATILGKRFGVTTSFSFESLNSRTGRALCLGRVVLLQREVNRFISFIRNQGIKVSSVHNEWLFDRPNLIYVNIEAVEKPLVFARKVRRFEIDGQIFGIIIVKHIKMDVRHPAFPRRSEKLMLLAGFEQNDIPRDDGINVVFNP
jgi:hypothetical protein